MTRRLIALLVLAVAACAGAPPPPDTFYRIEPAETVPRFAAPPLPGVIEVERLAADGAVAERALVFARGDGGPLAHYKYDFWSEPPGLMLQDRLARSLTRAGAADRVVTPDLRVLSDWTVRGKIRRFEQLAGVGMVAVDIQLAVVGSRTGELVLNESYGVQVPTASDAVEAAAHAMERGVSEIFGRFLADLGRVRARSDK